MEVLYRWFSHRLFCLFGLSDTKKKGGEITAPARCAVRLSKAGGGRYSIFYVFVRKSVGIFTGRGGTGAGAAVVVGATYSLGCWW